MNRWNKAGEGQVWRFEAVFPEAPTTVLRFDAAAWRIGCGLLLELQDWPNYRVLLPASPPLWFVAQLDPLELSP